ncbi:hypothetical protein BKH41_06745 [Helicobacter sp. 12S02232-10]|uniref:YbgC/FadM family acyl-CoA thioesterase n=1 Tax=Helicobacter sp. 12S02232-10 TaxID=1476197 RepID=UPI000BA6ADE1|nr:YbgC/FadM family acyl-CoA thioesterase [Helicobacter sp. 12S02232-10]PAF47951.1 hypothetical protein BKH41_06745 [Helicobacter sp. 12S02232-10]
MKIRVYYEDTDCGGIVYHTAYIRYCERARSEAFFAAETDPQTNTGGFVVRSLNADFIDSAMLGDIIEVRNKPLKIKNVSILLQQEIYKIFDNTNKSPCNTKIFQMIVKLGYIDFTTHHPSVIPKKFLEIINGK